MNVEDSNFFERTEAEAALNVRLTEFHHLPFICMIQPMFLVLLIEWRERFPVEADGCLQCQEGSVWSERIYPRMFDA